MSRYVAYVGSYTDANDCKGLTLFDMNTEAGTLTRRAEYAVSNASYISVSHDKRFLYSITDLGVVSFAIQPDGSLKKLNVATIRGMRGCHICLTRDNSYMFVSGYYDGKITVLRMNSDGSAGKVTCSIFHKGPGSIAERVYSPHCRCSRLTPDEKYLLVADSGLDVVKIYRFNRQNGTLSHIDAIHCRQQAGPRFIRFSRDGRYFYALKELTNTITVYAYQPGERGPEYTMLETYPTVGQRSSEYAAAVSFQFTRDDRHLICSNAGDNSAAIFRRDEETGLLTQLHVLPISGGYPTSIGIFPDDRHMFCTNHDSNSISFFKLDLDRGLILMSAESISIPQPNCSVIVPLPDLAADNQPG